MSSYRVASNFTLTKQINDIIQIAIEGGLYQIYTKWTKSYMNSCFNINIVEDDHHARPLKLSQIFGIFLIYFVGIFCAITAFFMEHLISWWCTKKRFKRVRKSEKCVRRKKAMNM